MEKTKLLLLTLLTGCASTPPFDPNVDCPLLRVEYEYTFYELFSSDPNEMLTAQYNLIKTTLERECDNV